MQVFVVCRSLQYQQQVRQWRIKVGSYCNISFVMMIKGHQLNCTQTPHPTLGLQVTQFENNV